MNLREIRKYHENPEELTGNNRLRIHCDGPDIFAHLLEAIDQAKDSIDMEVYIFSSDTIGHKIREALVAACKRGVHVRLMYDAVGSLWTSEDFFSPLEKAGGRVHLYHSIFSWKRLWDWNRRNHRKMVVVDRRWLVTGGFNVSDEYFRSHGEGGYHDLAIEVTGPAAHVAHILFEETWRQQMGMLPWAHTSTPIETNPSFVGVAGNDHFRHRLRIRRAILYAISQAQRSIEIINPYFLPDLGVVLALRRAVKRGVHVRVIVPKQSDFPLIDLASWIPQMRLRRRGVKIFVWPGMAHAKAVLVDRVWFSIGSYNFDHRSLFHNLEVMVNAMDEVEGERLGKIFDQDISTSHLRTHSEWKSMPMVKKQTARWAYFFRNLM